MLKYVLLATAMTVSAPVLAQTAPQTGGQPSTMGTPMGDATTGTQTTPATPSPTTPAPADPAATAPADPAMSAQTAPTTTPSDPAAAPTQSAQAAPAGGDVTSVVEAEFASYDKDSSGSLSKTEFASWMDALKAKAPADATASAKKPDPKWNDAAFKQADADKSKSVTKEELAGFLSAAPAAS